MPNKIPLHVANPASPTPLFQFSVTVDNTTEMWAQNKAFDKQSQFKLFQVNEKQHWLKKRGVGWEGDTK